LWWRRGFVRRSLPEQIKRLLQLGAGRSIDGAVSEYGSAICFEILGGLRKATKIDKTNGWWTAFKIVEWRMYNFVGFAGT
jgi:hypothetical protein